MDISILGYKEVNDYKMPGGKVDLLELFNRIFNKQTNLNNMVDAKELYSKTAFESCGLITQNYSTSFYSAVGLLDTKIQKAIYGIYGFVRLADEIVDTFFDFDQKQLLDQFEADYYEAYQKKISLNPVIHAFQQVTRQYNIGNELVGAFIESMRADLSKKTYTHPEETQKYIYGSADVVGLMCLKVFTEGDAGLYEELKYPAMKLGSAFQKVNFLRDMKQDMMELERSYFPEVTLDNFSEQTKLTIIREIEAELSDAYTGVIRLPSSSKLAVYVAYTYYSKLLKKIKKTPASELISTRIRVSDFHKAFLFTQSLLLNKINLV